MALLLLRTSGLLLSRCVLLIAATVASVFVKAWNCYQPLRLVSGVSNATKPLEFVIAMLNVEFEKAWNQATIEFASKHRNASAIAEYAMLI